MVEPLACVLHALQQVGGSDASHTAVVFGCGTLGLAMIALLAGTGAVVVAIDPSEQRRGIAAKLGASLALPAAPGSEITAMIAEQLAVPGADLVVECSGAPAAQAAALEVTRLRARVLFMGLSHGNASSAALRLIQTNELTLTSSTGAPAQIWEPALRLMQRTNLDLTGAVSDVYPFSACLEALAAAANPGTTGKVMLTPDHQ
jgi:L-iditol 2-dehydrogenase